MEHLPIKAMGLVIFIWSIMFFIFVGFGFVVCSLFRIDYQERENWLTSFWISWAFVIFLLQIWNIFLKVDWKVCSLIFIIGVIGIVSNYRYFLLFIKKRIKHHWVLGLVLIVIAIVISNRAILPPKNIDSGLYHLTSVRWAKTCPVVPGLGNLHGRLAFNSSYFLYVALFEIMNNKSSHFANGILLLVIISQSFLSAFKLYKKSEDFRAHHLFYMFCLIPVMLEVYDVNTSSPSPDLSIFILGILVSAQLLALLEKPELEYNNVEYAMFFITVLSILGITIKLSFLVVGISAFLLGISLYFIRINKQNKIYSSRIYTWIISCVVVGFLPWIIRGIVLSGYVAYPSTFGAFPVDWKIPHAAVINTANWVRSWARLPHVYWPEVLSSWDWFLPWLNRVYRTEKVTIPLLLMLASFLFIFYQKFKKKYNWKKNRLLLLFLLPSVLNIVYWFITAPELRFAGASFWVIGIGTLVIAVYEFVNLRKTAMFIIYGFIIFNFSYYINGEKELLKAILNGKNVHKAFNQMRITNIIISGDDNYGFQPYPQAELETFKNQSGLILYVPKKYLCWDAPLPCAPYPNKYLLLRKKNDLCAGFTIYPRNESKPDVGMHR